MRRFLFLVGALIGMAIVGAACQPFGSPTANDYVVFTKCAAAPCTAGNENILLMRDPAVTQSGSVTTRKGNMELRVLGRDGAYHNYSFMDGTIVENTANRAASSISFAGLAGEAGDGPNAGTWDDAFGVAGLDLSSVTFQARQDNGGAWSVGLKATPAYAPGSAAEALVPGREAAALSPTVPGTTIPMQTLLSALANDYTISLSDLATPMTVKAVVPMALVPASIGVTADSVTLTKVSTASHATTSATAKNAAATIGGTSVSNLDLDLAISDQLTGSVDASGTVISSGKTWNVGLHLPFSVTFDAGALKVKLGPSASFNATSASTNISFDGTITASANLAGAGNASFSLTDGNLVYNDMTVNGLTINVTSGSQGIGIDVHANTAKLVPGLTLTNVDLGWHGNTVDVHGTAQLTGPKAQGTVTVDGTATVASNSAVLNLTVTVPSLSVTLDGGTTGNPRQVKASNATFQLAINGDLTTRTVTLTNASLQASGLTFPSGTLGNVTLSGNLAVSGQIALGANLNVTGWQIHLNANVTMGSFAATALIDGSGGTLGTGGTSKVTVALTLAQTQNQISGSLNASLWQDAAGALHLEATANAHVSLGSKVVIDGTVAIANNKISVDAQLKFGTSTTVPVSGTITLNASNPLGAIPAIDLTLGRTYLTNKLWIDQVHVTNTNSVTHFSIDGKLDNDYALKAIGITVFDLGDLRIAGSVDLTNGNIASATAGNITYDLHVTSPDAYNKKLLGVFYVAQSGLDFHVWGNKSAVNMTLEAQAVFAVNAVIMGGNADAHISFNGSVNMDTGVVSVSGYAGAQVFAHAFGLSAEGGAAMNVSLAGNLNTSLHLTGVGTGHAGASFIGIPVAGGDIHLGGDVTITMSNGAVSGTAYANWGIDVGGGVFGNHDGDWKYNVAGTVSTPIITAHDSYWRDNHKRAKDINGQISPVKNLCGTYQTRGTFSGWSTKGTWGDCNSNGFIDGTVMIDTDRSNSATSPDTALTTPITVKFIDPADGNKLVGQTTTEDDGGFSSPVLVRPGVSYNVQLDVPSGYKVKPGTWGYATGATMGYSNGTYVWKVTSPTGANTTRDAGTFGLRPIVYKSLTGSVYNDQNGNGHRDSSEPGVSGLVVNANGPDGPNTSAFTSSTGDYNFAQVDSDLAPTVTVTLPAGSGWVVTQDPDYTLDAQTVVAMWDSGDPVTVGTFGICQPSSCGTAANGTVNGMMSYGVQGGSSLPTTYLSLTYKGVNPAQWNVQGTVNVSASGAYTIANVPAGQYRITVRDVYGRNLRVYPPAMMDDPDGVGITYIVTVQPGQTTAVYPVTVFQIP